MPRIRKDKVAPQDLYGVSKVDNNLSMRERIKERFRPSDTVEVKNITNQEITWQWLDEEDESYSIEDDTNIKIVEREDPSLWVLGAGETDVLPGACAYLMIEALFKLVCVMKIGIVLHPLDEREVKNFSFDDPERQEQFIDAVFVGKLTPTMMHEAAVSQLPGTGKSEITEHLAPLANERTEFDNRRPNEKRIVTPPKSVEGEHKELSDLADEFEPGEIGLGAATGGLPADRQAPPETESEEPKKEEPAKPEKPLVSKPATKKEPVKV